MADELRQALEKALGVKAANSRYPKDTWGGAAKRGWRGGWSLVPKTLAGAQRVLGWLGLPTESGEEYYTQLAQDVEGAETGGVVPRPQEQSLASQVIEGLASAPGAIAAYGPAIAGVAATLPASVPAVGVGITSAALGMGAVDALAAAPEGPKAAVKGFGKGALLGGSIGAGGPLAGALGKSVAKALGVPFKGAVKTLVRSAGTATGLAVPGPLSEGRLPETAEWLTAAGMVGIPHAVKGIAKAGALKPWETGREGAATVPGGHPVDNAWATLSKLGKDKKILPDELVERLHHPKTIAMIQEALKAPEGASPKSLAGLQSILDSANQVPPAAEVQSSGSIIRPKDIGTVVNEKGKPVSELAADAVRKGMIPGETKGTMQPASPTQAQFDQLRKMGYLTPYRVGMTAEDATRLIEAKTPVAEWGREQERRRVARKTGMQPAEEVAPIQESLTTPPVAKSATGAGATIEYQGKNYSLDVLTAELVAKGADPTEVDSFIRGDYPVTPESLRELRYSRAAEARNARIIAGNPEAARAARIMAAGVEEMDAENIKADLEAEVHAPKTAKNVSKAPTWMRGKLLSDWLAGNISDEEAVRVAIKSYNLGGGGEKYHEAGYRSAYDEGLQDIEKSNAAIGRTPKHDSVVVVAGGKEKTLTVGENLGISGGVVVVIEASRYSSDMDVRFPDGSVAPLETVLRSKNFRREGKTNRYISASTPPIQESLTTAPPVAEGATTAPASQEVKAAVEKALGVVPKTADPVDALIEQYNATGRVAYRYPRKKTISLSGLNMPEGTAIARMRNTVALAQKQASLQAPGIVPKPAEAPMGQEVPPTQPAQPTAPTGPIQGAGKPWQMTLYHGGVPGDISVRGAQTFTPVLDVASDYANRGIRHAKGSNVLVAKISLGKPLFARNGEDAAKRLGVLPQYLSAMKESSGVADFTRTDPVINSAAKKQGFDGIVYGSKNFITEVAVLRPDAIEPQGTVVSGEFASEQGTGTGIDVSRVEGTAVTKPVYGKPMATSAPETLQDAVRTALGLPRKTVAPEPAKMAEGGEQARQARYDEDLVARMDKTGDVPVTPVDVERELTQAALRPTAKEILGAPQRVAQMEIARAREVRMALEGQGERRAPPSGITAAETSTEALDPIIRTKIASTSTEGITYDADVTPRGGKPAIYNVIPDRSKMTNREYVQWYTKTGSKLPQLKGWTPEDFDAAWEEAPPPKTPAGRPPKGPTEHPLTAEELNPERGREDIRPIGWIPSLRWLAGPVGHVVSKVGAVGRAFNRMLRYQEDAHGFFEAREMTANQAISDAFRATKGRYTPEAVAKAITRLRAPEFVKPGEEAGLAEMAKVPEIRKAVEALKAESDYRSERLSERDADGNPLVTVDVGKKEGDPYENHIIEKYVPHILKPEIEAAFEKTPEQLVANLMKEKGLTEMQARHRIEQRIGRYREKEWNPHFNMPRETGEKALPMSWFEDDITKIRARTSQALRIRAANAVAFGENHRVSDMLISKVRTAGHDYSLRDADWLERRMNELYFKPETQSPEIGKLANLLSVSAFFGTRAPVKNIALMQTQAFANMPTEIFIPQFFRAMNNTVRYIIRSVGIKRGLALNASEKAGVEAAAVTAHNTFTEQFIAGIQEGSPKGLGKLWSWIAGVPKTTMGAGEYGGRTSMAAAAGDMANYAIKLAKAPKYSARWWREVLTFNFNPQRKVQYILKTMMGFDNWQDIVRRGGLNAQEIPLAGKRLAGYLAGEVTPRTVSPFMSQAPGLALFQKYAVRGTATIIHMTEQAKYGNFGMAMKFFGLAAPVAGLALVELRKLMTGEDPTKDKDAITKYFMYQANGEVLGWFTGVGQATDMKSLVTPPVFRMIEDHLKNLAQFAGGRKYATQAGWDALRTLPAFKEAYGLFHKSSAEMQNKITRQSAEEWAKKLNYHAEEGFDDWISSLMSGQKYETTKMSGYYRAMRDAFWSGDQRKMASAIEAAYKAAKADTRAGKAQHPPMQRILSVIQKEKPITVNKTDAPRFLRQVPPGKRAEFLSAQKAFVQKYIAFKNLARQVERQIKVKDFFTAPHQEQAP